MNFTTKNFMKFILACIGFSICFSLLLKKVYIGIPIGLFLALCICYDPKRYENSKKKYEEKLSSETNKDA
ncbi:MAG: hypothetical protein E7213_03165 [Clostridium sp.]|nr:hypothetical protein [Clostridium sp.]